MKMRICSAGLRRAKDRLALDERHFGSGPIFLPLYDGNPVKRVRFQFVTLFIIAVNVAVFAAVNIGGIVDPNFANLAFGHVPAVANDLRSLPVAYRVVPDDYYALTALTSTFLHADFFHLLGNMLFIWVFGDNVEDAMGHFRFLIFYCLCAWAASFCHALTFPEAEGPLIGASGAAAGLVSAYLMLHPKMKIWALFLGRIPLRLPAWAMLAFWIGYQFYMYVDDDSGNISWAAHVGGIVAGLLLIGLFKRRNVPLFDRKVVVPEAVELEPDVDLPPQVERPVPTHRSKGSSSGPWGRQSGE